MTVFLPGDFHQFLSVAHVVYVEYARELRVRFDYGMVIRRPCLIQCSL